MIKKCTESLNSLSKHDNTRGTSNTQVDEIVYLVGRHLRMFVVDLARCDVVWRNVDNPHLSQVTTRGQYNRCIS